MLVRRGLTALLRRLARDRRGAAAVEFALISPVLFLLTLGMIEVGMILLEWHRVGEAARGGARQILIGDPIAELASLSTTGITCAGADNGSVTCTGAQKSSSNAFADALAVMQDIAPNLEGSNVTIAYTDSVVTSIDGLITPVLSLSVTNYQYTFFFLQTVPGIGSTMTLPAFTTSRMVHTTDANNT